MLPRPNWEHVSTLWPTGGVVKRTRGSKIGSGMKLLGTAIRCSTLTASMSLNYGHFNHALGWIVLPVRG